MKPIRVLSAAEDELNAAAAYYESQRSGLGQSFLEAYAASIARIRQFPGGARRIRGSIRQLSILKWPYMILYRVTDDEILIVAICHRRRSPNYRRIEECPAVYGYQTSRTVEAVQPL